MHKAKQHDLQTMCMLHSRTIPFNLYVLSYQPNTYYAKNYVW